MRGIIRVLEPWADPAIDLFSRTMPPGDRRIFSEPGTRRMFQEDLILGSRINMHALWLDAMLFGRAWGFALEDVRVPVFLRYGDADVIVPSAHGEHMAGRLPNSELRVYPGEGHVGSLGASREIFDALLERSPVFRA
jgi:pimeloyl-ACP methyl ester carboxylesterase